MILSQRLVRILCENCKQIDENNNNYYRSVGCVECNLSGYKNRKIVTEVLELDNTVRDMISNNISILQILDYLLKNNFKTMQDNAKLLVNNGITTLEEYYSKV
jgi:type IV pilus assembly protein PilB